MLALHVYHYVQQLQICINIRVDYCYISNVALRVALNMLLRWSHVYGYPAVELTTLS